MTTNVAVICGFKAMRFDVLFARTPVNDVEAAQLWYQR